MKISDIFQNVNSEIEQEKAQNWNTFLVKNNFNFNFLSRIDMSHQCPEIFDSKQNKFCIDFVNNKINYHKKKQSIKSELLSKALGAGKYGNKVLDLSAGLGIDSVFLAQLGYEVTAVERNPLIYLALENACVQYPEIGLKILFGDATELLKNTKIKTDIIYFDPMFPEKIKSALPRQEMVFFKAMVGADNDAASVLEQALQVVGVKRVAVKRPLKAPVLAGKPVGSVKGKLVRFDIYGGLS